MAHQMRVDYIEMNPLEDPIVRSTLERIQMSGADLIGVTVKDLNKRLTGCPNSTISRLKKCRRTLKNRGYAKNCRIKRLYLKNELQLENSRLKLELDELRLQSRLLQNQINELRLKQDPQEHQPALTQQQQQQLLPQAQRRQAQNLPNMRVIQEPNYYQPEQPQVSLKQQPQPYLVPGTPINNESIVYGSQPNAMLSSQQSEYSSHNSPHSSMSSLCLDADYTAFDTDSGYTNTSGMPYPTQDYCDSSNWKLPPVVSHSYAYHIKQNTVNHANSY